LRDRCGDRHDNSGRSAYDRQPHVACQCWWPSVMSVLVWDYGGLTGSSRISRPWRWCSHARRVGRPTTSRDLHHIPRHLRPRVTSIRLMW